MVPPCRFQKQCSEADMGQNRLLRPRWKILNDCSPATVSDVMDVILENRNIDPLTFFGELKDLSEHLCIRGMTEGAGLLAKHMANRNKIVVVADYDCDGITSAAQIALFLQETGYQNFRVIIPSRSEGYGIPERAISENPDAKVFVALDCGTLDRKPIRLASSMGADCIVIDHHEVSEGATGRGSWQGLAPASVLINPKHPECGSTFKEFCASGLTFLFLASLRRDPAERTDRPVPSCAWRQVSRPRGNRNSRRPRSTGVGKPDSCPKRLAQSQRERQRPTFNTGRHRRSDRQDLDRGPHRLPGPAHQCRRAYLRGANSIRSADLKRTVQAGTVGAGTR